MRKILITGGTNFVSRYVAEHFVRNGDDVTVINRGSRPQPDGVRHIRADRTGLGGALKGLHFDAVLDVTAYTEEHVVSLLNALEGFDDYVLISSSAVYPETNPLPFDEAQPCGSNSVWGIYGENKLKAERALKNAAPNAYILRPPYLYGAGQNLYREPFVFDCARLDRPFYIPRGGEMPLQFFHVRDLCRFIELLLEKHTEQKIFNVGNPDTVSVRDWVTLCYRAAGKSPEFVSVDGSVPQRSYFCFHDYAYSLDVKRMAALMPDTLPLTDGIAEEWEWYRSGDREINRRPYIEWIEDNLNC